MSTKKDWSEAENQIHQIISKTELSHEIKWGMPVYTNQVLGTAQKGKTKAMRQWRFSSMAEIEENTELIHSYLEEAIANQKAGKEIKAKVGKPLVIPAELQQQLDADAELKEAFESLNLTKKRDFVEYIEIAKREETKLARLEKIIPMIKAGIGLNDKYK